MVFVFLKTELIVIFVLFGHPVRQSGIFSFYLSNPASSYHLNHSKTK